MRLRLVIVVKLVNHFLLEQTLLARAVLWHSKPSASALGKGLQLHPAHFIISFIVEGLHIDGARIGDLSSVPISRRRVIVSISMPLVVHAALSSVYIIDIVVETLKVDFVIMTVKLLNVDILALC